MIRQQIFRQILIVALLGFGSSTVHAQSAINPAGEPNNPEQEVIHDHDLVITKYIKFKDYGIFARKTENIYDKTCSVDVQFNRVVFLQHVADLNALGFISPISTFDDMDSHRFYVYFNAAGSLAPVFAYAALTDARPGQVCSFFLGFQNESFLKPSQAMAVMRFQFDQSTYENLDWDRVNAATFLTTVKALWMNPHFEKLMQMQEAGYKDYQ
ncbi:hypothetical protein [Gluconobacter cerinus]|uniref:hypothetical protein n=1 Tax=Gluconobacter cerinus TaxID=38307 RepID=UPI001B8BFAED|nr:hypothetical protein [Gluconobacter cerinus]MBS1067279.1 hypothetical protein [Gluconobacter cerinus]